MRIRKKPSITLAASSEAAAAAAVALPSSAVCSWCGGEIEIEIEQEELPSSSCSDERDEEHEELAAAASMLAAGEDDQTVEQNAPQLSKSSTIKEEKLPPLSSAQVHTPPILQAKSSLSHSLRLVFAQTPNVCLTPRQALTRMIGSGLSDPQSLPDYARVAKTMQTDPYFVQLKRGRFAVRKTVEDDDCRLLLFSSETSKQKKIAPKAVKLDKANFEPDTNLFGDAQEAQCSARNGTGWKCSNKAKLGYLLCEHHLAQNCMRNLKRKLDRMEGVQLESPGPKRKRVRKSRYLCHLTEIKA